MGYYRTRKAAWEVRAGDMLQQDVCGSLVAEPVEQVRRFEITGELNGVGYDGADVVVITLGGGGHLTAKADDPFTVWRRKGG